MTDHIEREVHAPRCYVPDCLYPGRFLVGHGDIQTRWCIHHIEPEGLTWLMDTVEAVRQILRPHNHHD